MTVSHTLGGLGDSGRILKTLIRYIATPLIPIFHLLAKVRLTLPVGLSSCMFGLMGESVLPA